MDWWCFCCVCLCPVRGRKKTAKEITTAPQSPKQKTKTHHCALLTDDRSRSRQQVQNKTNLLRTSKNERTHNSKTFAFAVKERQKNKNKPEADEKTRTTMGTAAVHQRQMTTTFIVADLMVWVGLIHQLSWHCCFVIRMRVSLNSCYRGHFLWKRNAHECEPKKSEKEI